MGSCVSRGADPRRATEPFALVAAMSQDENAPGTAPGRVMGWPVARGRQAAMARRLDGSVLDAENLRTSVIGHGDHATTVAPMRCITIENYINYDLRYKK